MDPTYFLILNCFLYSLLLPLHHQLESALRKVHNSSTLSEINLLPLPDVLYFIPAQQSWNGKRSTEDKRNLTCGNTTVDGYITIPKTCSHLFFFCFFVPTFLTCDFQCLPVGRVYFLPHCQGWTSVLANAI